ncbi:uncharacterized protein MYCFIDRAFT_173599 [Pseudocercospora fijiensis CIRAD86]|uniref:Uncharacterized protein n=1 Tax=Pseudocercospora fijiensis (strain CIRAD86) TaxID=383855 RepID=M2Z4A7_PSEFD|nr:uncharacterized protein MYCFIDRAFT_173599 [Pseudocercospora fijiensis CIRAD86]EME84650.1 hypothetical protein MYCFIDRAFT_173599 [Pseudocercospora fijiensis CIRAD86]
MIPVLRRSLQRISQPTRPAEVQGRHWGFAWGTIQLVGLGSDCGCFHAQRLLNSVTSNVSSLIDHFEAAVYNELIDCDVRQVWGCSRCLRDINQSPCN